VAAPVVVVGVAAPALFVAAWAGTRPEAATATPAAAATGEATPHTHATDASAGATTVPPALTAPPGGTLTPGQALGLEITGNASHDHGHGSTVVPDQPMDAATRAQLAEQLIVARKVALAFPTVADATKAGYRMITPFVPLIGAHYIKFESLDGNFDPVHPEMLLYDGTSPGAKIVGLSYLVSSESGKEPAGFAGPNDHWHQHHGLCLRNGVVVGGEKVTDAECARRGGQKLRLEDLWMVHVWVVPGWESPQGVFSPEHADLLEASSES
jgi:hypothetical protein